jgi:tRNA pseudouridine38-40 synthase
MPRIKLIIEYDGGYYHGFQSQENAATIQTEIEKQVLRLTGEAIRIMAAGRTDAGVHAHGQVVAFDTQSTIPAEKWAKALNTFLPEDIRVLTSCQVSPIFHPQFDALRKQYGYYIYRQKPGASFYRRYALCMTEKLDIGRMEQAAQNFEGTYNFKSFCARGSSVKTYRRTVFQCIGHESGPLWRLTIEANGFLYNMVRIIVGTLLEVGRGKIKPDDIIPIIISQDRTRAGPTVPPQGLHLLRVTYPPEFEIEPGS